MIEILTQVEWEGFLSGKTPGSAYTGRLSKCRLDGVIFYVRERMYLQRFYLGSGVGIAAREGRSCGGIQVLDLCAPTAAWKRIARQVQKEDALHRPVLHYRHFTVKWAEEHLTPTRPEAVTSPQP